MYCTAHSVTCCSAHCNSHVRGCKAAFLAEAHQGLKKLHADAVVHACMFALQAGLQKMVEAKEDVNKMKAELAALEGRILGLLSASSGNILDDEELINTLAQAKVGCTAHVGS